MPKRLVSRNHEAYTAFAKLAMKGVRVGHIMYQQAQYLFPVDAHASENT